MPSLVLDGTPAGAPWGWQPPPRLTPHRCRCLPIHHQGCLQNNRSAKPECEGVLGRDWPLKVHMASGRSQGRRPPCCDGSQGQDLCWGVMVMRENSV